jgi:hypothetical protein
MKLSTQKFLYILQCVLSRIQKYVLNTYLFSHMKKGREEYRLIVFEKGVDTKWILEI